MLDHAIAFTEALYGIARLRGRHQRSGQSECSRLIETGSIRYTQKDNCGQIVLYHLDPLVIHRAVMAAVRLSGITKPARCHAVQLCFATHQPKCGSGIRTIQDLLGCSDVKTILIYTHVLNQGPAGVASPADFLADAHRVCRAFQVIGECPPMEGGLLELMRIWVTISGFGSLTRSVC